MKSDLTDSAQGRLCSRWRNTYMNATNAYRSTHLQKPTSRLRDSLWCISQADLECTSTPCRTHWSGDGMLSCRGELRLLFTGVSARTAARSDVHPSCTASSDVLQALSFVVVWIVVLGARAGRIAPPLHSARPNRSSPSGQGVLPTTSSLKNIDCTSRPPPGLSPLVARHQHQCFKE